MSLKFCKLDERAHLPVRKTSGAGGYDLYAIEEGLVSNRIVAVKTGVGVIIPQGYVGIIKPRSSLAANFGLDVKAGVIDSDYRGEIKVMLKSSSTYQYNPGDRIAQLVVVKCLNLDSEEILIDEFNNESTDRGDGGFGSTGINC